MNPSNTSDETALERGRREGSNAGTPALPQKPGKTSADAGKQDSSKKPSKRGVKRVFYQGKLKWTLPGSSYKRLSL